jgi:hypothetical protein
MNASIEQLEAKLAELQGERDELASVETPEVAAKAARDFCAIARRTDVRGFVLGAVAVGEPLQAVINAFVLSDPRLESWAVEQAQAVDGITLSDRQRDSRLRKIDDAIAAASAEILEARKREALAEVERQFSPEAA